MKKNIIFKLFKSLEEKGILFTLIRAKRKLKMIKFNQTYHKVGKVEESIRESQKKKKFPIKIKFSILVPLYNTPERFLKEMILSVRRQTYTNWELCLVDGSDRNTEQIQNICMKYTQRDKRIHYKKLEKNLGISGNTNCCIDLAKGDYIVLFDHDDILHESALFEVMKAICNSKADFVYTDEIVFFKKISNIISVHLKPGFSINNLRANNYICHMTVFKKVLLEKTGKFRSEYDGSQDYDLILRLAENAERIVHIPKILYFWRAHKNSVASDILAKSYAVEAGRKAVESHLKRCNIEAKVKDSNVFPAIYCIEYKIQKLPFISILLYQEDDQQPLEKCIKSIQEKTTYKNYEIIKVGNSNKISNFSRAIENSKGEYLLFLSGSTKIISPNWIEKLLEYAQQKEVGAVGAKLYYNNKIYHAGITFDKKNGIRYPYQGYNKREYGYMGKLCYAQDFTIVSGVCMLIEKEKYNKAGGLTEGYLIEDSFYDMCLRLAQLKYTAIFQPEAELYYNYRKKVSNRKNSNLYYKWIVKENIIDPYYIDSRKDINIL